MSQGTARLQRQIPEQMAAQGLSYGEMQPFDWQRLAQTLSRGS